MSEETKTVSQIMEEVKADMCRNYCKYPSDYEDYHGYDQLLDEICNSCPSNRL